MNFLKKLKLPDYFSLTALFFAWISIILLLNGEPNLAIVINIIAFIFDLIDGQIARSFKLTSQLGREIDSTVDIITYIIFSAIIFHLYLTPSSILCVLGGFLIIFFGVLRLLRFNHEGILINKQGKYYRGITVVHISSLVLICYFLQTLTSFWSPWLTLFLIIFITPLMLSNIKSYKWNSTYYVLIGLMFIALSLFIEYGYNK